MWAPRTSRFVRRVELAHTTLFGVEEWGTGNQSGRPSAWVGGHVTYFRRLTKNSIENTEYFVNPSSIQIYNHLYCFSIFDQERRVRCWIALILRTNLAQFDRLLRLLTTRYARQLCQGTTGELNKEQVSVLIPKNGKAGYDTLWRSAVSGLAPSISSGLARQFSYNLAFRHHSTSSSRL